MKRIIIVLVLLLSVSLVACSGGSGSGNSSSSSSSNSTSEGTKEAKGDEISVEEFYVEDHGSFYYQYVKVRNNTDEPINHLIVYFQVLDKNGDIIQKHDFREVVDLEPGQAATMQSQARLGDGEIENVGSFKFTGFDINEHYIEDGKEYRRTLITGKFAEAPVFKTGDFEVKTK